MLTFDKDFFEDEERDGFLVQSMVKRSWASQMEILRNIDVICSKHGIQYFTFWGTMLGAVRHKGFVPWDDDMDIMMKRADYDKFIEVAQAELPDGFTLLSIYNEPGWDIIISRVTNGFSISYEDEFLKNHYLCPYVCGIDIFVYDYYPDDEATFKKQENFLDGITMVRNMQKEKKRQLTETGSYDTEIDKKCDIILTDLERCFDFEFERDNNLDNQLLCMFDLVSSAYGTSTDKYMTSHLERRKRESEGGSFKIPSFWLEEAIDYPFEGYTVRIPKYYELCLSRCYGNNFMTPIKGGGAHDYPFYKKQEGALRDQGMYDDAMESIRRLSMEGDTGPGIIEFVKSNGSETVIDNIYEDTTDINEVTAGDDSIPNNNGGEAAEFVSLINEWRQPDKKVIMCCISIMDFYDNEEQCLEKLARVIDLFHEKRDEVCTILLDAPNVTDILSRKSQALADKYISLINDTASSDWCLVIGHEQHPFVAPLCDAYYGSANEYIKPFQDAKKPIMIVNPTV